MHRVAVLVSSLLLALAVPGVALAQRPWLAAQGPHVTVLSDADANRARDLVWQFEQVRTVIARVWPWIRTDMAKPVVVLAARNEAGLSALAPSFWEDRKSFKPASVSISGYDRTYIALRADLKIDDQEGINPYATAYWSYAAQALGGTTSGLPPWLSSGLASIVSNSLVRSDHIQVGRVLPQHLNQIRSRARLRLSEVVAITRDDPRYRQEGFRDVFDAQAWALVHFLMWGDQSKHQPQLNRYVTGLLVGQDATASLASTLGDMSQYENAFDVYVGRDLFPFVKIDADATVQRQKFPVQPAPVEEAAALRASFHAAMKRPVEAKALIAEARAASAGYGGADEAEALLADYDDRDDEARQLLEKAAGKPGISWYVPYRLASLLARSTDPAVLARVETLLEAAIALNPSADSVYGFLGEVKAELGRGPAALASAEKAVAMVPASAAHRVSMARVLLTLGRPAEAARVLDVAKVLARSAEERTAVQNLQAEIAKRKPG